MPTTAVSITVGDALRRARACLQATSASPAHDARLLLTHTLDASDAWLYAHADTAISDANQHRFDAFVERRASGEPLPYITGHCGFWTLDLAVNPSVLVPRPDTETLVETTLATLAPNACRIVELGTGSGAIALALASERPEWHITATDASAPALACARANARRLDLQRVQFRHGSWFAAVDEQRFDAIVANPPYIATDDPHLAAPELRHEPAMALTAGSTGLGDLAHIISTAPEYLRPSGWLLLEHGFDQGAAVRRLFRQAGFHSIATRQDLGANDRVTCGRHGQYGQP